MEIAAREIAMASAPDEAAPAKAADEAARANAADAGSPKTDEPSSGAAAEEPRHLPEGGLTAAADNLRLTNKQLTRPFSRFYPWKKKVLHMAIITYFAFRIWEYMSFTGKSMVSSMQEGTPAWWRTCVCRAWWRTWKCPHVVADV